MNYKYLDIDFKNMMMVFVFMQMSQGCPKTTQPFGRGGFLNVGVVAGDTQRVMEERRAFQGGGMIAGQSGKMHRGRDGPASTVVEEGSLSAPPLGNRGAPRMEHPDRVF